MKAKYCFFIILVSPKFLTTDVVFVGKIQENVSITFYIYSNPKDVTAKLYVNGSVINNNEKYVLMINKGVSEELNLTITIVDLDESDFTDYSLDVTNFINTTEVQFTVKAESRFFFLHFILSAHPHTKGSFKSNLRIIRLFI